MAFASINLPIGPISRRALGFRVSGLGVGMYVFSFYLQSLQYTAMSQKVLFKLVSYT